MSGMKGTSRMGKGCPAQLGCRIMEGLWSCRSVWADEIWFLFLSWDMFVESSPLPCSCRVCAAAGRPNHPGVPDRRGALRAQGLPSGVDGQVGKQPGPEAGFAAEFPCPYPCCEQPGAELLAQTTALLCGQGRDIPMSLQCRIPRLFTCVRPQPILFPCLFLAGDGSAIDQCQEPMGLSAMG